MAENGIIPVLRAYSHAETDNGKTCAQMEKNTCYVNMAGLGRSQSNPPGKFVLSVSAAFSRRRNIKAMFTFADS